jgi:hypothetical protein
LTAHLIDIKDPQAAAKPASLIFKSLPLVLAFRTILQDFNFAFFYSEARLARVLILPVQVQTSSANNKLMKPNPVGRELAHRRIHLLHVEPR